MKKSDLKTGMKCVCRDGNVYIVMLDAKTSYTDRFNSYKDVEGIFVNPKVDSYSWISFDAYSQDLLATSGCELDIMEISIPEHPYDIFYNHSGYRLIWKREQKTQSQIQLEAVMSKLSELQAEAQRLQEIVAKENK